MVKLSSKTMEIAWLDSSIFNDLTSNWRKIRLKLRHQYALLLFILITVLPLNNAMPIPKIKDENSLTSAMVSLVFELICLIISLLRLEVPTVHSK